MDTLDRYLTKEFCIYFTVILFLLAALFLGVDFFTNIWDFRIPMSSVLTLYGYKIPAILNQMVPIACLMATLLTISQMSRQNEVLALYSSGIGTIRVLSTLVAIVAVISTVSFLFFDSAVPLFNRKQELVKRGLSPTGEISTIPQGGFWYRSGNLIYRVGHISIENNSIENLHVYLLNPNFQLFQKIYAQTQAHSLKKANH